jgi:hypothetical protein
MKRFIQVISFSFFFACSMSPEGKSRLDHLEFGSPLSTNAQSLRTLRELKQRRQKAILLFILESNCRGCVSPAPYLGNSQKLLFDAQTSMIVHFVKDQPQREIEVKYNNIFFFLDDQNLINHFAPETFQITQLSASTPRARPIYVYIFFDENFKMWKKKTVYARPLDPAQLQPYLLQ